MGVCWLVTADNLQQLCFEILLKHSLVTEKREFISAEEKVKKEPESVVEEAAKKQDDISDSDLHVKIRRFLDKYDLSVEHLNQIFYKENDQILSLYDDLKTTSTSGCQIRITLLQSLKAAITTGEFKTTVEKARKEVQERKCYESSNWGSNYTNNADLFDFDKYSKKLKDITLTEEGKKELAKLIKELQ